MIVPTKVLFEHAYGNYALGAYNINNLEQAMGLFRGCIDSQAPFIIQISKGARGYTDKKMLEAIIRTADEIFPEALFAVHLDHGDEQTAMECIESGFYSSVMIDASHDPFDENIAATKRVATAAHKHGISVEAELGMLGGVEEDIAVDEKNAMLTDPIESQRVCGAIRLRQPLRAPSEPVTARTSLRAGRASTLIASKPFRSSFPAFRSSCTVPRPFRTMRLSASTRQVEPLATPKV